MFMGYLQYRLSLCEHSTQLSDIRECLATSQLEMTTQDYTGLDNWITCEAYQAGTLMWHPFVFSIKCGCINRNS
jgi:hypothetical protein